jgi:hypothetical protein
MRDHPIRNTVPQAAAADEWEMGAIERMAHDEAALSDGRINGGCDPLPKPQMPGY